MSAELLMPVGVPRVGPPPAGTGTRIVRIDGPLEEIETPIGKVKTSAMRVLSETLYAHLVNCDACKKLFHVWSKHRSPTTAELAREVIESGVDRRCPGCGATGASR